MGNPRWLSPSEQQSWRTFIDATRRLFEELDRELQRDAGIPHAYYEILVRLSEAPARTLRMSALAERSQFSRSRLSHAVARLETMGWVRRDVCDTDRRGLMATLTDKGFAALEAAAPGHVEAVRRLLVDPLSAKQMQQLGAISQTILRALGDTDCEPDAPAA